MATKEEMSQFIGQVMADPELKKRTIANPMSVAKEHGLVLTPEQEKLFKEGIKAVGAIDNELQGGCYYRGCDCHGHQY